MTTVRNCKSERFSDIDRSDASSSNIALAKEALRFVNLMRHKVVYLKDGKEYRSSWFNSYERAKQALDVLTGKGYQAVILLD